MVLNIHYDASYRSETRARSRVARQLFLGRKYVPNQPLVLNGSLYVMCGILKFVVALAVEAELEALFLNFKEGRILRSTLRKMGHSQPPTPVRCDNMTATVIANDTAKKQRSQSMEMRLFWVTDQVKSGTFDVQLHPGQESLADYPSKHHGSKHHLIVRTWYMHQKIHRVYYRALQSQVVCEGVLEIYPAYTTKQFHSQ